jgi:hypothetical protein
MRRDSAEELEAIIWEKAYQSFDPKYQKEMRKLLSLWRQVMKSGLYKYLPENPNEAVEIVWRLEPLIRKRRFDVARYLILAKSDIIRQIIGV